MHLEAIVKTTTDSETLVRCRLHRLPLSSRQSSNLKHKFHITKSPISAIAPQPLSCHDRGAVCCRSSKPCATRAIMHHALTLKLRRAELAAKQVIHSTVIHTSFHTSCTVLTAQTTSLLCLLPYIPQSSPKDRSTVQASASRTLASGEVIQYFRSSDTNETDCDLGV